MKQTFNFNINQILATYMYAKVKCLDLLSIATTREEIRFAEMNLLNIYKAKKFSLFFLMILMN